MLYGEYQITAVCVPIHFNATSYLHEITELSDYARVQEKISLVHDWFLEWSWNSIFPNVDFISPINGQDMDNLFNSALMELVSRG